MNKSTLYGIYFSVHHQGDVYTKDYLVVNAECQQAAIDTAIEYLSEIYRIELTVVITEIISPSILDKAVLQMYHYINN